MKAIAIIPCYQEEQTIADLVFKMYEFVGQTIVVDDNSSDNTGKIAQQAGAKVLKKFGKRGFGSAMRAGIDDALSGDCEIIVTLDGDGQHNPSEAFKVIKPIEEGIADVVIGSRFLENNTNIPKYRKFGIKVITAIYNIGSKQKLTDSQCCFRAYRRDVLSKMPMKENGFTFSTETLIRARAMGYKIMEVPISVLYHKQFSKNSTLNPIIHGISVAIRTLLLRFKIEHLSKI
jgi:glycosyltransferase involved in cell wall biosynthesis